MFICIPKVCRPLELEVAAKKALAERRGIRVWKSVAAQGPAVFEARAKSCGNATVAQIAADVRVHGPSHVNW